MLILAALAGGEFQSALNKGRMFMLLLFCTVEFLSSFIRVDSKFALFLSIPFKGIANLKQDSSSERLRLRILEVFHSLGGDNGNWGSF